MAKLKGPLFSLGASGAIGEALVYFPWKGLNVAREYVVPSNPRTTLQTTQRSYLTAVVLWIHDAQAQVANPLDETDTQAYALWGSTYPTPRTWFNQAVKNWLDQFAATPQRKGRIFRAGATTPGADQLGVSLNYAPYAITGGNIHYGTSKTALINTKAPTITATSVATTLTGLTTGVKYFWQFRATTPADAVGVRSGIYYGYPT